MDITFDIVKTKVIRLLADEVADTVAIDDYTNEALSGNTFNAELLRDAIHAALDAITIKIGKSSTFEIDANSLEHDTPTDLINIDGVYDNTTSIFLPKMSISANKYSLVGIESNAWIEYPYGSISFVDEIGDSGATVYYSATWTKPVSDDDTLEPPEYTLNAILLYAASYCLLNQASGSANIRQYQTKVDSGVPTDIPAKDMSDFFLKRFEIELQRIPQQERGVLK